MATSLKPRRCWLTFSLRSFFIAMTIFSIWLGVAVNRARQQREAVKQLGAICGKAIYDWEPDRRIFGLPAPPPRTHPPGPSWLRKFLGDEYFQEVRDVDLNVCRPGEEFPFRGPQRWAISEEELGAAIPILQRFPRLRNVWLRTMSINSMPWPPTPISDDGTAKLKNALPNCTIRRPGDGLYRRSGAR